MPILVFKHNEPLSRSHIAGFVATLTLHIAVLIWLTAYMSNEALPPVENIDTTIPVEFVKPIKPVIPPPPLETGSSKPKVQTSPSISATTRKSISVLPTKIQKDATVPVVEEDGASTEIAGSPVMTGEIAAAGGFALGSEIGGDGNGNAGDGNDGIKIYNLKPKHTPASDYPRASLRNQESGIVLLLVKVDVNGIPLEAQVIKSSGFRTLDEKAKRHILTKWQFYPAMRQGVPIPAYVLAKQIYNMNGQVN
jgi:periplasmic protein TonB